MNATDEVNERTALLAEENRPKKPQREPTPLPKLQLFNLLLLQLAEPITSQCIYPFLNQLVGELPITGGDPAKIGYYAGMISSCFFATEAVFVLHWSMLSDRIGRKPVLLIGMGGLCISMVLFGLSRTLLQLILSRCLVGMLNGNTGVMKSMMGEITDSTNMAQAFALLPIVWSCGSSIGPMIGGYLARPHDRWPNLFSGRFWVEYPYFLPCAASAAFSAYVFVHTYFFLQEPGRKRKTRSAPGTSELAGESNDEVIDDKPLPLRAVLTRPVIISVGNYGLLALLEIAYLAIMPLFLATPIELGGLGQTPAIIGTIMGTFGIANGIFQAALFAKVVGRMGPKRLFMGGIALFPILFAFFPIINSVARKQGISTSVWALIGAQLSLQVLMDCSYGCIFMFVTSAAPNKRSLGTTNGVGQLIAAIVRAIGPALASSLFALSIERNWLGGNAVYVFFGIISGLGLFACNLLPAQVWHRDDD
ncbi:hypothetical protein QCA50_006136 [Cerrena zonata]|uniref:Major facilitator superfamily (MFS) profile domain-containing protein n=1 Tax=Cerrena zonata TaxID=2478898 RepID=A0AAW0GC57_9APHY